MRVDRTSILELFYEALDGLHHAGMYRSDWTRHNHDKGPGCTCHRNVVRMETSSDLTAGTTAAMARAQENSRAGGQVNTMARKEIGLGVAKGSPERCWDCCDSWKDAVSSAKNGCLASYAECYEAYEDDERCQKRGILYLKTRNCVFQKLNFAGSGREG